MPWSTIAAADVLNEFTPAEQATLQGIQGTNTNLASILTKVVKRMRSQINAGGNQLDQTGLTLPDSLIEDAIAVARWRWIISFPGLKFVATADRKDAAEMAEKRLAKIASSERDRERTELPAVMDTTPVPVIQPSVSVAPKCRRFTRRSEDGIV